MFREKRVDIATGRAFPGSTGAGAASSAGPPECYWRSPWTRERERTRERPDSFYKQGEATDSLRFVPVRGEGEGERDGAK